MPASPWMQSIGGPLLIGPLVDVAASIAVLSGAPAGHEVRTVAGSATHFRPATVASQTLIARARTVSTGARLIFTEVLVEDALGREVGRMSATSAVSPVASPRPGPIELGGPVEPVRYATPDPHQRPLPAGVGVFGADMRQLHDGLSLARMIVAGELPYPPVLALYGASADVGPGRMALTLRATEWLCDRTQGEVAAGPLMDLVAMALSGTAMTVVPAGAGRIAPLSNTWNFTGPVASDGQEIVVEGRVIEREGGVIVSAVRLTDGSGRCCAIAHQTSLLVAASPPPARQRQRRLLTLLFTDLVQSTQRAGELRDEHWGKLLAEHHSVVRRALEVHHGWEIKTTGDGFLATFDDPTEALECARRIRTGLQPLGLGVRIAVHIGQCEVDQGDVAGIAVHVAARVLAAADPGDVLVTSTVRDLLLGSDVKFEDRGRRQLKGIEGEWQLFAVKD